ncbi:MAG: hypothetical protein WBX22_01580 [Silvibacterium sp.]
MLMFEFMPSDYDDEIDPDDDDDIDDDDDWNDDDADIEPPSPRNPEKQLAE